MKWSKSVCLRTICIAIGCPTAFKCCIDGIVTAMTFLRPSPRHRHGWTVPCRQLNLRNHSSSSISARSIFNVPAWDFLQSTALISVTANNTTDTWPLRFWFPQQLTLYLVELSMSPYLTDMGIVRRRTIEITSVGYVAFELCKLRFETIR